MGRIASLICVLLILVPGCLANEDGQWRVIYNGTELGGEYAPDFTLTNQDGENVSLSDFEGKVVVIGFTYTSCPDVCPLIEANLNSVKADLGDAYGERVVFISISIDPVRDTPDKLKSHWIVGLGFDWEHLTHENLSIISAVWNSYNLIVDEEVFEQQSDELQENQTGTHNSTDDGSEANSDYDEEEPYVVGHSSLTLILDSEHRKRVAWPGFAWSADDFTEDVRAVLDL